MDYRRLEGLFLIFVFVLGFSGCAQLKEKFIPKPKEEDIKTQTYYQVRTYDVHPSIELYTKRYTFWKTWHGELLEVLSDGSHKKKIVAVEQSVSNLMDMQRMLIDGEAEKLQGPLDEMIEIEGIIKKERVTHGNAVRLRKRLESLHGEIRRGFTYNKMKGSIRDDFREQ